MHSQTDLARLERRRFEIAGTIQGIGFRPFVFRLAHELKLSGWVRNVSSGVEVEVQGRPGGIGAGLSSDCVANRPRVSPLKFT